MKEAKQPTQAPDDDARIIVEAHLLIKEKDTGKVLVNKRG